jgi:hypothetical protein
MVCNDALETFWFFNNRSIIIVLAVPFPELIYLILSLSLSLSLSLYLSFSFSFCFLSLINSTKQSIFRLLGNNSRRFPNFFFSPCSFYFPLCLFILSSLAFSLSLFPLCLFILSVYLFSPCSFSFPLSRIACVKQNRRRHYIGILLGR